MRDADPSACAFQFSLCNGRAKPSFVKCITRHDPWGVPNNLRNHLVAHPPLCHPAAWHTPPCAAFPYHVTAPGRG